MEWWVKVVEVMEGVKVEVVEVEVVVGVMVKGVNQRMSKRDLCLEFL